MGKCYVSMPFRVKSLWNGDEIDFDRLYRNAIKPAVIAAGFECFRGDELDGASIVQKATLAAILKYDVMIADVSSRNPNVLYELGLRHAASHRPTIVAINSREKVPFHLSGLPMLHYNVDEMRATAEESLRLKTLLSEALRLTQTDSARFRSPLQELFPDLDAWAQRDAKCVFVGHGRSSLFSKLHLFLQNELGLSVMTYEASPRGGLEIIATLEACLKRASFAFLIFTAEDAVADGTKRPRQNVVHEAGLFQGALGFHRAVVLRQRGAEHPTNLQGVHYLEFDGDEIEHTFYEVQRVLEREGLLEGRGRR